jgi:hypothetical protein
VIEKLGLDREALVRELRSALGTYQHVARAS